MKNLTTGIAVVIAFLFPMILNAQPNKIPKGFPPEAVKKALQDDRNNLEHANKKHQHKNNRSLFTLFSMMDDNSQAFDVLEMLGDQKGEIEKLRKQYKSEQDALWKRSDISKVELRNELGKLKTKYITKINKILLPHQLKELSKADVRLVGLHKALTDSVIGDALGLTEQQKKKIRSNAALVADDIEKQVTRIRQKSYDAIFNVLTKEQREKITRALSERQMVMLFEQNDLVTIFNHLSYLNNDEKPKSIMRTKVKRFSKQEKRTSKKD